VLTPALNALHVHCILWNCNNYNPDDLENMVLGSCLILQILEVYSEIFANLAQEFSFVPLILNTVFRIGYVIQHPAYLIGPR